MPIEWEAVSVEPVKMPDGRVSVPKEVITSMERTKLGLKGDYLVLFSLSLMICVYIQAPLRHRLVKELSP